MGLESNFVKTANFHQTNRTKVTDMSASSMDTKVHTRDIGTQVYKYVLDQ